MKNKTIAPSVPTVNLCVNKSRIKLYNKSGEMPTYYLQKGQEFQFELFNPTSDVILAKIQINGKAISQGGLVLNPGQRVFLDRYLDIPKKFLFDTYEVANTDEVKKAIENNGDIKVEFFKEYIYVKPTPILKTPWHRDLLGNFKTASSGNLGGYNIGTNLSGAINDGYLSMDASANSYFTSPTYISSEILTTYNTTSTDYLSDTGNDMKTNSLNDRKKNKKSIETGRVEMGSTSDQEIEYVNKDFHFIPFHTIEYKLLPVSQKINTVADVNVKRYCTNCGHKVAKTDNFCSKCGKKA